MSYTVLARKYRSTGFDDLVGQDAIATTLRNAVTSGRVHHGYLFTGTRGVGKTSTARILAKALNCMAFDQPTPTPCGKCEACLRIAEGEDLDVVEIDAASNTGVDNIRELRSNAAFRPARARFKVYIIDEVHMLSAGAFNALLKTLEEPPPHVKFILATTESHKVPATIQSRCQRFDFRSIDVDTIAARLKTILKSERLKADEAVVRRVARLANGSMRDALSLLDQLLSFGAEGLTPELIEEILPTAHDEVIHEMIEAVAASEAATALRCVERCLSAGYTAERFCEAVIDHVRTLMLLAVCGADTDLVDLPAPLRKKLTEQAQRFDAPTYVYIVALLEELRRSVKSSGSSRALLDAAIVRLASVKQFTQLERLLSEVRGDGAEVPARAPEAKKKDDVAVMPPPRPAARSAPTAPAPQPLAAVPNRRPASGTAAASSVNRPSSSADRQRVMMDPLVRGALELFNGSLVDVRPASPPVGDRGTGVSPAVSGGTPDPQSDTQNRGLST
ncbi:MAG TPA: DNA polymerase III subunit gamma/tau [Phycisphaerae bacterium]|jgi:DNA polymerase-3 subunit gamma/tau